MFQRRFCDLNWIFYITYTLTLPQYVYIIIALLTVIASKHYYLVLIGSSTMPTTRFRQKISNYILPLILEYVEEEDIIPPLSTVIPTKKEYFVVH